MCLPPILSQLVVLEALCKIISLFLSCIGFSTCVLDEWRKFYPQTEESNKTIGYKLAKFDRGPDTDVDEKGVKITPKGRIMWSQIMLNNLQLAKKRAMERVGPTTIVILKG